MKLTIKYISLIVNKSDVFNKPQVVAAARCLLCKNNSGYDDKYIYCTEITGGSVGLSVLELQRNWCPGFKFQETKYTKLL